ncbi:hypothetical protein GCM10011348_45790 [Marinobacterium nitratireducens]|uniref:Uncharacterized protein n=1 Tax=Marinobacterium nitratireducens TaxID=518897 RepID=A0A917ZRA6_9GAMM|nr:hypothetical protein [Marinobacterium nitratireducens]GGO89019.1 hypothetical protein GCM10011348_45790 [Marinobacterium nitratireducens]
MANSNAGGKLYIAVDGLGDAEVHNTDLTEAQFDALTWLEVKQVGSFGETGSNTNILTYDTWDTDVSQKAKGITNGGDPEVEVARVGTDPGQIQMRAAALTKHSYAFKIEHDDSLGTNGTIKYNRGVVGGPRHPNGRNEDFNLEIYSLGMNQLQIVKEAA